MAYASGMAEPTSPGTYLFRDAIGAPAQRVEVLRDGEDLVVRFPDHEPGDDLPRVVDLAGEFSPA